MESGTESPPRAGPQCAHEQRTLTRRTHTPHTQYMARTNKHSAHIKSIVLGEYHQQKIYQRDRCGRSIYSRTRVGSRLQYARPSTVKAYFVLPFPTLFVARRGACADKPPPIISILLSSDSFFGATILPLGAVK